MNVANALVLIKVLQRVVDNNSGFSLKSWVDNGTLVDQLNEEECHKCGTVACAGGWLAFSPEFKALGGGQAVNGAPIFAEEVGLNALGNFLGLRVWYEQALFCGGIESLCFYDVESVVEIKPEMVIAKLEWLIESEIHNKINWE